MDQAGAGRKRKAVSGSWEPARDAGRPTETPRLQPGGGAAAAASPRIIGPPSRPKQARPAARSASGRAERFGSAFPFIPCLKTLKSRAKGHKA